VQEKISANPKYKDDFTAIIGNIPIGDFDRTLDQYIRVLQMLKTESPDASLWVISSVLFEPASRARSAVQELEAWARFFINQRSPAARRELESFL